MQRGYLQIYTGNGKGKTTAALGQAVRAAGSGLKTFIVMFMKDHPYGEIKMIDQLGNLVRLEQYGNDAFVLAKQLPLAEDRMAAQQALARIREIMNSGEYDIIIMDEVCVAIHFELLKTEDVLCLLNEKPDPVEIILTGRYCPPEFIEMADLVTEMLEIKHYYPKGVIARRGIES